MVLSKHNRAATLKMHDRSQHWRNPFTERTFILCYRCPGVDVASEFAGSDANIVAALGPCDGSGLSHEGGARARLMKSP